MAAAPLIVRPHEGIGSMRVGTDPEALREVLAGMPGYQGPVASAPDSARFSSGLTVQFEIGASGLTESVEVWRPAQSEPQVMLEGVPLFQGALEVALSGLRHLEFRPVPGGGSLVSRSSDIGLTVEDSRLVAVLVGVPGYYELLDGL